MPTRYKELETRAALVFMAGSLAFRYARGNHSGMPTYHFCITAEHEDPIPPVAELQTIEASDPHDALAKLRQSQYRDEPGIESAWIRVAVSYYPDSAVRHAISQQVQVVPVSREN